MKLDLNKAGAKAFISNWVELQHIDDNQEAKVKTKSVKNFKKFDAAMKAWMVILVIMLAVFTLIEVIQEVYTRIHWR